MATRSRKKTIKCLYGQLRASQLYDVALTAPTIVEIKHFLKNHPKCAQIWVQDNPQLTHALPSIPLDLPSFLQSQAQAQKQFADDYRRSVQVSVTLSFAAQHLARPPARTSSFPTIFRCLNPDSQRSFCLFVYLDFEMTSRIYTVPELLALKGSQSSQALLDRVKATPELGMFQSLSMSHTFDKMSSLLVSSSTTRLLISRRRHCQAEWRCQFSTLEEGQG